MFDEIENNLYERGKDDGMPRSCCSIEDEPTEKRVRFNYWHEPLATKTPQKGASDRYLPLRKTPGSAK